MSAFRPSSRRGAPLARLLSLGLASLAMAAPPRVLDRIPQNADAILAVDSINRLDQNTSQLLTAIELHAISTLSQALGAMGLRDGLDLSGSAAGVFFNHAEGPEALTRFVLLLPVQNCDQFLGNLRAQADGPAQRFEYAGSTYFARDLGAGLLALGPERDLIVSFDATAGQLGAHLNRFGARGRELADRADLLAIADSRSLAPLLAGALGPLLEGAPGAGLTDALMGDDPRSRFASALMESVAEQSELAMLSAQAGPLGLRLDLAIPFKPESELAALCQAAPPRPSGLRALPQRDYLFLGSLNLSHPGLRHLFQAALTPPENDPGDKPAPEPNPFVGALAALRGVDSASIAIYTPPSLMIGALTQTALAWEARDAGAPDAFRRFIASLNGRPVFAAASKGDTGAAPRPLGKIESSIGPAQPPFRVQDGETAEQWAIVLPSGTLPAGAILFGMGAGPSGYFGITQSRGVVTWSRDRALFETCMEAARAANPPTSALGDVMLSQVAALLPPDRCLEWFLNVRPAMQIVLPMLNMPGQAAPARMPELLPPVGASVSLSDGSLHAAAFVPAPLIRVAVGVINRVGASNPAAQDGQTARPR